MMPIAFKQGETVLSGRDPVDLIHQYTQTVAPPVAAELDAGTPCQGGGYFLRVRFADEGHILAMLDTAEEAINLVWHYREIIKRLSIRPRKLALRLNDQLPATFQTFTQYGMVITTDDQHGGQCNVQA